MFRKLKLDYTAPRSQLFGVSDPTVLSLYNVFFPFGIVAAGIILATLISVVERLSCQFIKDDG